MLSASILPEILFYETGHTPPPWLTWGRVGVFAVLFAVSLAWPKLRPLRDFLVFWLALFTTTELVARVDFSVPFLQNSLGGSSFVHGLQPQQFGKLAVTACVLLALALFGYSRKQLYLTPGKLDAPITPVKWMGFPKPDPWPRFGLQYGFYIPLGMALVAYLIGRPSAVNLAKALPALPAILIFAALNAFNEEMSLRATMLAALESPVGKYQAWYMSALYFGIAHFYGVPYGWVGIALATFNGWLLGKAMLETRGMLWAWWMHFLQDVAIFVFLAAGVITPGG